MTGIPGPGPSYAHHGPEFPAGTVYGGVRIANPFSLANPGRKPLNGKRSPPGNLPGARARGRARPTRPERGNVRLSNRKIEHLGKRILKLMQEDPRIHPAGNTDLVLRAIEDAMVDNVRTEDEIDQEVEKLLAQNVNEIRAMEMDVGALRAKMKRELARKRKFVL